MGNFKSTSINIGQQMESSVKSFSESNQVRITNGSIDIKTKNIKKVNINGSSCLPCSELKMLEEKLNNDPQLKSLYDKYCSHI